MVEIAVARDGSDHGGAAPERELRGERADRAEHALDEDRGAFDGAVGEDGAVCGYSRHPKACTDLVADLVGELDRLLGGNDAELSRRAEGAVGLRSVYPHALPD